MANTIREQIILKLMTRAALIKTASGYNTDIGLNALRAIDKLDPDELPALVIWPLPETSTRQYGKDVIEMKVRIEGLVAHGSTNSSVVAELILGDLRKCFTDPSIKSTAYGSLLDDIFFDEGGPDTYAKAGDLTTGSNVILTINYSTNIGNPYSNA